MKRNSTLFALAVMVVVLTLGTTAALAQGRGTGPRPGPLGGNDAHGPLLQCLRILDLSADQQVQVRSIIEAAQPMLQVLREEAREARQAVRPLVEANADACEIGAAVIAAHEAGEALRAEMKKVLDNVKLVLTPEQATKLEGCIAGARDGGPVRGRGRR